MARGLTPKQLIFCESYLETLNGTEASRRAYKARNDATLAVIASENLRKPKIREYIDKRMTEMQMSANEVLVRLSQQGSVSISDYVREEKFTVTTKNGETFEASRMGLNWDRIRTHGHLIKSIKNTQHGPTIELYDGQTALIRMGMRHALFTEKVDYNVTWRLEVLGLIQSGQMTPEQLISEVGSELAEELFESAGVPVLTGRAPAPGAD